MQSHGGKFCLCDCIYRFLPSARSKLKIVHICTHDAHKKTLFIQQHTLFTLSLTLPHSPLPHIHITPPTPPPLYPNVYPKARGQKGGKGGGRVTAATTNARVVRRGTTTTTTTTLAAVIASDKRDATAPGRIAGRGCRWGRRMGRAVRRDNVEGKGLQQLLTRFMGR
jgi:hypothetical protein